MPNTKTKFLKNIIYTIVFIFFYANFVKAEGTKELRPASTNTGSLHISNNTTFTKFGQYNAPPAQQLKIQIGAPGEKIYYGFNNHLQGSTAFVPNIPYRILSPTGDTIIESTMPSPGQPGHLADWNKTVAGPTQLGNVNGYNALSVPTDEIGDYILEFNISSLGNAQLQIDLIDVTVAGNDLKPQPGRLHSQGWQISTEDASNPFFGKVYPYNVKGVVYEVDFNKMQPYTFVIFFNSKGTANTGNFITDRQSKEKFNTFPEYEVFLNPPDPLYYPSIKKQITFESEAKQTDCTSQDYCLNFTSNAEGILEGFIDIDGNGLEEATDVRFTQFYDVPGTKCIKWNGKDNSGKKADLAKVKIYSSFGYGVTHLPLFDVEENISGFKVRIVSPVNNPVNLFWDDSNISAGNAPDGKTNLDGCSNLNGCHKWSNRGDNSNPESINTWWYTTLMYDTMLFSAPENPSVQLSFNENKASKKDTTICLGSELEVFINKDVAHFDDIKFSYSWFVDGVAQNNSDHSKQNIKKIQQ